jgi:casein kinase 1
MFDRIKEVHEAGYLYCDLKLNNVLIGGAAETALPRDSPFKARLIDFGLSRKYLDANGEHVPNTVQRVFRGNVIFASKHLFNLDAPSRRDDLISLCYLMLYLVDGDLQFISDQENPPVDRTNQEYQHREFKRIKGIKNLLTPELLCETAEAKLLLPFLEAVFALEYSEKPNYDSLRFTLLKGLLEIN